MAREAATGRARTSAKKESGARANRNAKKAVAVKQAPLEADNGVGETAPESIPTVAKAAALAQQRFTHPQRWPYRKPVGLILLFLLTPFFFICLWQAPITGVAGEWVSALLRSWFGNASWIVPLGSLALALAMLEVDTAREFSLKIGTPVIMLSMLMLGGRMGNQAGVVGNAIDARIVSWIGPVGSWMVAVLTMLAGFILLWQFTGDDILEFLHLTLRALEALGKLLIKFTVLAAKQCARFGRWLYGALCQGANSLYKQGLEYQRDSQARSEGRLAARILREQEKSQREEQERQQAAVSQQAAASQPAAPESPALVQFSDSASRGDEMAPVGRLALDAQSQDLAREQSLPTPGGSKLLEPDDDGGRLHLGDAFGAEKNAAMPDRDNTLLVDRGAHAKLVPEEDGRRYASSIDEWDVMRRAGKIMGDPTGTLPLPNELLEDCIYFGDDDEDVAPALSSARPEGKILFPGAQRAGAPVGAYGVGDGEAQASKPVAPSFADGSAQPQADAGVASKLDVRDWRDAELEDAPTLESQSLAGDRGEEAFAYRRPLITGQQVPRGHKSRNSLDEDKRPSLAQNDARAASTPYLDDSNEGRRIAQLSSRVRRLGTPEDPGKDLVQRDLDHAAPRQGADNATPAEGREAEALPSVPPGSNLDPEQAERLHRFFTAIASHRSTSGGHGRVSGGDSTNAPQVDMPVPGESGDGMGALPAATKRSETEPRSARAGLGTSRTAPGAAIAADALSAAGAIATLRGGASKREALAPAGQSGKSELRPAGAPGGDENGVVAPSPRAGQAATAEVRPSSESITLKQRAELEAEKQKACQAWIENCQRVRESRLRQAQKRRELEAERRESEEAAAIREQPVVSPVETAARAVATAAAASVAQNGATSKDFVSPIPAAIVAARSGGFEAVAPVVPADSSSRASAGAKTAQQGSPRGGAQSPRPAPEPDVAGPLAQRIANDVPAAAKRSDAVTQAPPKARDFWSMHAKRERQPESVALNQLCDGDSKELGQVVVRPAEFNPLQGKANQVADEMKGVAVRSAADYTEGVQKQTSPASSAVSRRSSDAMRSFWGGGSASAAKQGTAQAAPVAASPNTGVVVHPEAYHSEEEQKQPSPASSAVSRRSSAAMRSFWGGGLANAAKQGAAQATPTASSPKGGTVPGSSALSVPPQAQHSVLPPAQQAVTAQVTPIAAAPVSASSIGGAAPVRVEDTGREAEQVKSAPAYDDSGDDGEAYNADEARANSATAAKVASNNNSILRSFWGGKARNNASSLPPAAKSAVARSYAPPSVARPTAQIPAVPPASRSSSAPAVAPAPVVRPVSQASSAPAVAPAPAVRPVAQASAILPGSVIAKGRAVADAFASSRAATKTRSFPAAHDSDELTLADKPTVDEFSRDSSLSEAEGAASVSYEEYDGESGEEYEDGSYEEYEDDGSEGYEEGSEEEYESGSYEEYDDEEQPSYSQESSSFADSDDPENAPLPPFRRSSGERAVSGSSSSASGTRRALSGLSAGQSRPAPEPMPDVAQEEDEFEQLHVIDDNSDSDDDNYEEFEDEAEPELNSTERRAAKGLGNSRLAGGSAPKLETGSKLKLGLNALKNGLGWGSGSKNSGDARPVLKRDNPRSPALSRAASSHPDFLSLGGDDDSSDNLDENIASVTRNIQGYDSASGDNSPSLPLEFPSKRAALPATANPRLQLNTMGFGLAVPSRKEKRDEGFSTLPPPKRRDSASGAHKAVGLSLGVAGQDSLPAFRNAGKASSESEAPQGKSVPRVLSIGNDKTGGTESAYRLPSISLLDKPAPNVMVEQEDDRSDKLMDTLASFKVKARLVNVVHGPAVTRYELEPERGERVKKFTSLRDDLALALAAKQLRIEAPVPGKPVVGIEVPNQNTELVSLYDVLASDNFRHGKGLRIGLGKDIAGTVQTTDLHKMPHLLIAGTTGSGKSVCINTLIVSLLFRFAPTELQLLMIDPKQVELSIYEGIPHLIGFSDDTSEKIVCDPKKASMALNQMVELMEQRYTLFSKKRVRNLKEFNSMADVKLPWVVVIIDELADLMMIAAKAVETSICRLAQKARAAGIVLVVATQRPSADVITGLIKANIPSRIAFAVSTQIDSRVILDVGGAEHLLGKGDMLFRSVDAMAPTRIQGAFVTNEEIERLVEFWSAQNAPSNSITLKVEEENDADEDRDKDGDDDGGELGGDELLARQALEIIISTQQSSVSFLQTELKIGYARARRIMSMLEKKGYVGPQDGSKQRRILCTTLPDDAFL